MKERIEHAKILGAFIFAIFTVLYFAVVDANAGCVAKNNPLIRMNYKEMSDESCNRAFMKATDYEVGQFLYSLTETERKNLLKRDTVLKIEGTSNTYRYQKNAEKQMSLKPFRQESLPYYELAMNKYLDELAIASGGDLAIEGAKATKSYGGYRMHLYSDEELTWKSTIEISGVDTTKELSEQQTIYVKETFMGNLTGGIIVSNYGVVGQAALAKSPNKADGEYRDLALSLTYEKRPGYYVEMTTDLASSYGDFMILDANGKRWSGELKSEEDIKSTLTSYVDIIYNTTLGQNENSKAYGNDTLFSIYFKPCEYQVDYDGNGATAGATLSDSCKYMEDYHYKTNGFSRSYRVSFDGNGGNVSDAHKDCHFAFAGWGEKASGNTEKEIHKEGAVYYNLTKKKNEHVKRYALWNEDSITLPKAEREGYQFAGWSKTNAQNQASENLLQAYTEYVPTQNETLYAVWKQNASPSENAGAEENQRSEEDEGQEEASVSENSVSQNQISENIDASENTNVGREEAIVEVSPKQDILVKYTLTDENEAIVTQISCKAETKSLTIPDSVKLGNKEIPVVRIEENCMKDASKLTSIRFDCKQLKTIGKNAFKGCVKLKSVNLSKATELQYISDGCFMGCTKLTKVTLPKNIKKIGKKAFYGCKNLKKVTIKSTKLNYVGSKAFVNCHKKLRFVIPREKKKSYQKLFRVG